MQKQYISSGNVLVRTKIYKRNQQNVWVFVENKNIQVQLLYQFSVTQK
jgi:hypothetical protein